MTSAFVQVVFEPGANANPSQREKLGEDRELRDTMRQFGRMSLWFSLNNGVTQCALMLTTTELGMVLGGWGIALACVVFSITCLFFSSAIVRHWGSKRALVLGLGCNYVWMVTYFVAYNWLQRGWPVGSTVVFMLGGVFGGFGAGAGWTAQGTFFTASVRRHADAMLQEDTGEDFEEAQLSKSSTILSARFAVSLLGIEALLMLFVSSIMTLYKTEESTGAAFIFFTFPVLSILSTVAMAQTVREPEPRRKRLGSAVEVVTCEKMGLLLRAYATDLRLLLLVPFQACFCLVAALGLIFINGNLTVERVGSEGIGNFSAIVAGVALLVTGATTVLQERCGVTKPVLMVAGAVFIFAECWVLLRFHSSSNFWFLVVVYVLHGIGRSVYESVNKGLCADYFGPSATAEVAFASIVLWDGASTFAACVAFPYLLTIDPQGEILVKICMGSVIAGLLCCVLAEVVHRRLHEGERRPLLYSKGGFL